MRSPQTTSRWHALGVYCPRCGARAAERCTDRQGQPRGSCHIERHDLARELGAPDLSVNAPEPRPVNGV